MACNASGSLLMGFVAGISIGLAMTSFALIFVTMKYRMLMLSRHQ